jgi:hypothetical protein
MTAFPHRKAVFSFHKTGSPNPGFGVISGNEFMRAPSRFLILLLSSALLFTASGCRPEKYSAEKAAFALGADLIMMDIARFSTACHGFFKERNFEALEARAAEVRAGRERFGNGAWKLEHLYASLACKEDAPESTWQHHEKLLLEWRGKMPESITARVAHANFLVQYAWHGRGSGYSNEITEEGWRVHKERLAAARTLLEESRTATTKCPALWHSLMQVALGQSWSKEEFATLFEKAKAVELEYHLHDLAQARFLMVRWHGSDGDWEAAAEREIRRPGGLGHEGYARVIADQRGYYDDIFKETQASWELTRTGFDQLRKRHPDSAEILNTYARLAVIAEDKELAKKLFDDIGERIVTYCWGERKRFFQMRRWARF